MIKDEMELQRINTKLADLRSLWVDASSGYRKLIEVRGKLLKDRKKILERKLGRDEQLSL